MNPDIPTKSGFETVLRWNARGKRIRPKGQIFESPYLEPPTIIEREAGLPVDECFGCKGIREDIQDGLVECCNRRKCCRMADGYICDPILVPFELCRVCRAR